jgi:Lsr2
VGVGRLCGTALQPFMEAGRRTAARKAAKAPRAAGSGTDRAAVRAWAAGQGLKVSERGRISAEVMCNYDAVH